MSQLRMVLIFISFIGVSCATTQALEPNTIYRKDLWISGDGYEFEGVAVLDYNPEISMEFRGKEEPEVVRVSNCHRDEILKPDKKRVKYSFHPAELEQDCFISIGFLNKNGMNQYGLVVLRTKKEPERRDSGRDSGDSRGDSGGDETLNETLPASVLCSGSRQATRGVSVCQGKSGSIQSIKFGIEVAVKSSEGCEEPESEDGMTFAYNMQEDYCMYIFKYGNNYHRLITYGYNEIIPSFK